MEIKLPTNNKNEWIDAKEAAKLLGMHPYTLYGLIKKNEGIKKKKPEELTEADKKLRCPPYARIGTRNKFTREAIEKFIVESMNREGE
jgi:predicted DNA-binding transcriptional regulator AlpA